MTQRSSYFTLLLEKSSDPVGICTTLILAWMAHADGILTKNDREMLSLLVHPMLHKKEDKRREAIIEELISIAAGNNVDDLASACDVIRMNIPFGEKELFLDLLIGMMISDNRVNLSERYILEFMADLLGVLPDALNYSYKRNTGTDLVGKGDPSSISWWSVHGGRNADEVNGEDGGGRNTFAPETPQHAYAVLGLHANASNDDIQQAYRRLADLHHPDRFRALGDEAVYRANITFGHIKNAFDILNRS